MKPVAPPPSKADPDRYICCQEALQDSFAQLAAAGVEAGWDEGEVAAALVDLADHHMLALLSNHEVDRKLESLKTKPG